MKATTIARLEDRMQCYRRRALDHREMAMSGGRTRNVDMSEIRTHNAKMSELEWVISMIKREENG